MSYTGAGVESLVRTAGGRALIRSIALRAPDASPSVA